MKLSRRSFMKANAVAAAAAAAGLSVPGVIQATHTFHIEIQQDHVDIQSIRQIDRARGVARFGDHFKARIKLQ